MWCKDCEAINESIFDQTVFWIHVPISVSLGKLAALCGIYGYDAEKFSDHGIRISIARNQIDTFITALYGELSPQERKGTQILTTPGHEPSHKDMGRTMNADVFINRYKSKWILQAVEDKTYESWFQPIVLATNPLDEQPFAHEALFRMRDNTGTIMPPDYVFDMAAHSDLLFSLDLIARRSAVEGAAKAQLKSKIFINFNPTSIYDPAFCLRTTAAAVAELGFKPSDIVFEITETHRPTDKSHLKGVLSFYRSAGFGVALDDIGSGWSSLNMLHEYMPDYVKIDMDLVRDVHETPMKMAIVENLVAIAKRSNIRTIAEGVEKQEEADFLIGTGVDYLQGYLYGRPELKLAPEADLQSVPAQ